MANTDSIPSSVTIVFARDGKTLRGGESIRRNPVTGQLLPAIPIGKDPAFPWDKIGGEINGAALATIAERDDTIADLTAKLAASEDALKSALAQLAALSPSSPVPDRMRAWLAALPQEVRDGFAQAIQILTPLIEGGKYQEAALALDGLSVPDALVAAKAEGLAILRG